MKIDFFSFFFFCKFSLSNFTSIQKCNSKDQSVCGFIIVMQLGSSSSKGQSTFCIHEQLNTSVRKKESSTDPEVKHERHTLGFDFFFFLFFSSACAKDCFALITRGGAEAWQNLYAVQLRLNCLNEFL